MCDADDAQLNATDLSLLAPVLMCWFHVTQNVEKKLKEFCVSIDHSQQVWSDVYDMHYCRTHNRFVRNSVLVKN